MAKTKISEFSANPANNTDIDNINIAEGCAPSGINDAIRELMAQLKDFQAGTAGDAFNGNVVGNVTGNVTGNADTVTNGVYTTGNQTITGLKTFNNSVQMTGASNRFVQINDSSAQVTELGVGVLTGNGDSIGLNNPTATGSVSIGTNSGIRVHVQHDGKVVVNGSSSGSQGGQLHVYGPISASSILGRQGIGGTSNGSNFNFWWTGSQAQLWVDATNVGVISLTSDYRIKKDVETQTAPAIERVMQLRPVTYQITDYGTVFKADGKQREGFIAHELQAVIPSGVDGEKDDPNQVQSLRMDAVVAVLTKAIQEQQATITALTARIAALESAS